MTSVRLRNSPRDIGVFIDEVEAFAHSLPATIKYEFAREGGDGFRLRITPPSDRHRQLALFGNPTEFDYTLGNIWTERIDPRSADLAELLAMLDAVRAGQVREVRDRHTGLIYHVYRLSTRGVRRTVRDSQYSLWHWLRLRIRRVEIRSLPPLSAEFA